MDSILEVINERYTVDNGESNDNGLNCEAVEIEEGADKNKPQQDENDDVLKDTAKTKP